MQEISADVTDYMYEDVRTIRFSADLVHGPTEKGANAFTYNGGSISVNSLGQISYATVTDAGSLRGQGAGTIFGTGLNYGFGSGEVTPGTSVTNVAVAGGALGVGVLGTLSHDAGGATGPIPNFGRAAGDLTVGIGLLGFGDAFLIPILVRNAFDIEGTIDQNSSAYSGGMITGTVWGAVPFALEGAAAVGATRFGSVLNANRYFRIGPGRWGGEMLPRISSRFLPGHGHFSLMTRLPPIPPVGALAPTNGCGGQ